MFLIRALITKIVDERIFEYWNGRRDCYCWRCADKFETQDEAEKKLHELHRRHGGQLKIYCGRVVWVDREFWEIVPLAKCVEDTDEDG